VAINSTSGDVTVQNIKCQNCTGTYGGILKSGVSNNPIINKCTVESSKYGLYGYGDVTVDYCDFKNTITDHIITLSSASTFDLDGNNNIVLGDGDYAVNNRTDSYVYADNNWWGDTPSPSLFPFPSSSYIDYSTYKNSTVAAAGVYKRAVQNNLLEIAQQLEMSGDFSGAIEAYRELLETETHPGRKKFLITSILRAHDHSDKDYNDVKQIIEDELPGASGYYNIALKYILNDINVRVGNYQQAIDGFLRDATRVKGTSMEVEMLAHVAEIYGFYMNDKSKAMQYAEMAAELNPGQPILRGAFAAAGEEYNTTLYEDIYEGKIDNIDILPKPIDDPVTEETQQFVSISPNPANPATIITYSITEPSNVKLEIYSISGQKVATLVDSYMQAGVHSVAFNGSNLASGVYVYNFESKGFKKSGKMLMVK